MSQDKNNVAVVDTVDIKKLINEMTVVNTQILSNLTNQKTKDGEVKEGLISQLNGAQQMVHNQIKLLQFYLSRAEGIEDKLKSQQTKVEENENAIDEAHQERLKELLSIKSSFEMTNEVLKDFNQKIDKKIEGFERVFELRTDVIQDKVLDELNKFKTELAESLKVKVDDINKSIINEFTGIDLNSIQTANTNAANATKTLTKFINSVDDINSKYIIAVSLFCFTGGAAIASLFFYFFM